MNSVLQSLVHTPPLAELLLSKSAARLHNGLVSARRAAPQNARGLCGRALLPLLAWASGARPAAAALAPRRQAGPPPPPPRASHRCAPPPHTHTAVAARCPGWVLQVNGFHPIQMARNLVSRSLAHHSRTPHAPMDFAKSLRRISRRCAAGATPHPRHAVRRALHACMLLHALHAARAEHAGRMKKTHLWSCSAPSSWGQQRVTYLS